MKLPRWWGAVPVALIVALFALRALIHTPPLAQLAPVAAEPADPPGTRALAGSIYVARGGPVILGFASPGAVARVTFAATEIRGSGVVTQRIVVPRGPTAIRVALPPGARLVWSPVGRRGVPEYVSASSLSPLPPAAATFDAPFDAPGTARSDGAIGLALLAVAVATAVLLARRRLALVSRPVWLAFGAVLAVGLAARWIGLGDAGQTWDEDVNWGAGRNYLTNLLALDFSPGAWAWNFEHPPVMKLLAGVGAQLADGMGPSRALSAVWAALGCALLVPIGARLYRLRVGVLGALIATLLPPLLAHGQIVGHEAPSVLWWALGAWLALGVHDGEPSVRRRAVRLAAVGAVVGIAISSRFINGLLGPLCAVIVVAYAPAAHRRATALAGAVVMPLAAIATCWLVWPRLWLHPLAALQQSFAKLDALHGLEPYLGTLTNTPGPGYFALYLAATLPLGILVGVAGYLVRAARDRDRAALVLLAWLALPLVVALSPVRQDGVRYVLPCLLALSLMAAAALDAVVGARRWFAPVAAAVVAYLAITAARIAPYYLDYFGEHVGGAGQVARARWFETAWWGEGVHEAVAYVNAHAAPGARVFRECIEPAHLAWFREDLWTPMTRDQRQATWIVAYAPLTRGCSIAPDAVRVFEVRAAGAPLAIVYRRP